MGLFKDAFDIGAGATLGNLAIQTGYAAATGFLDATEDRLYTEYRSERFDPVIRQDLCDIIVRGALEAKEYPFPLKVKERGENIFVRHKKLWIIAGICLLLTMPLKVLSNIIRVSDLDILMWIVYFLYYAYYMKKVRAGKFMKGIKNRMSYSFKATLIEEGKQYWNIREYVRQVLQVGELSVEDAIVKISRTELGCQFPDTVDQIEANAFHYRQRLGL